MKTRKTTKRAQARRKKARRSKPAEPAENKWPAANVEMVPVSQLVPYARNARTHSPDQVDQVAASIKEWGWTVPILIDEEGGIIAGHCRVMAASKLGIESVPAMTARGWTEAQKRAYVIADNKLATNAGWDEELLRVELADLQADGFEMPLIGFSLGELNDILDTGNLSGQDDVASDPPANPVTKLGDVWVLGNHRLLCGDSTNAGEVGRLFAGAEPLLMVTDPPYGVNYDPAWRNEAGASKTQRTGTVMNDDRADWTPAWQLFPGDIAYVWHGAKHSAEVFASLEGADLEIRSQIIWRKQRFALSRGNYHWQHEPCYYATRENEDPAEELKRLRELVGGDYEDEHEAAWYAYRAGTPARWAGGRRQSTFWDIPTVAEDKTTHGTQKPLECMARAIRNHDVESVYDPFCGSGTTLIACEILDKRCYAMDLDPAYCDVIVKRWMVRSGQNAHLEGSGDTFAETASDRGVDLVP